MKAYIVLIVLIIISCFLSSEVLADITNVHIEVEGGLGGKGIAVSRGVDCFVITAKHVVGDEPLPIKVIGADGKTSTAVRLWADSALDIDLAVIQIENPDEICGRDFYMNLDSLEQRMKQARFGVLRIRSEDGSEFELNVQLVSWSKDYIHVKQQSIGQEIGERLSGSMLYYGLQPLGLLVKVSTGQDKIGYVYRIDRIKEEISKFLPLTEPFEEKVRFNDQLMVDVLRKHVNYMQTEDFCRNLWRVAKWVAKQDTTYSYTIKRKGLKGGHNYIIKSMLFPGVNSEVQYIGIKGKHRDVVTRIGYMPATVEIDEFRGTVEQAIDRCYNSDINKEIGKIKRRNGMRREDDKTTWEMSGGVNIWLRFDYRGITLRIWTID